MERALLQTRLLTLAAVAAALALAAGCTNYGVPGRDKPWPSLGDFPVRTDTERLDARRRRLIGRYGDPAEALPKPAELPRHAPAGALEVGVIQFARGSGDLDGRAADVLEQVAAYAQQARATVWLFGYTSQRVELASAGSPRRASQRLAVQRARAVGIALIKAGVPADRIVIVARGAREPAYEEITAVGVAGNRRVEIFLQK